MGGGGVLCGMCWARHLSPLVIEVALTLLVAMAMALSRRGLARCAGHWGCCSAGVPVAAAPHAHTWRAARPRAHIAMPQATTQLAPTACVAAQELLPMRRAGLMFATASAALRTALLGVVLLVAMLLPFFALVMSLIGAFLSMSISIVLPTVFFMVICKHELTAASTALACAVGLFGCMAGAMSTYQALAAIAGKL